MTPPPLSPPRSRMAAELVVAVLLVLWYHWPFFALGLPPGDFGSDVAGSVLEQRLVPSPFAFPTWDPWTMCGRPTTGFMSPFAILRLPFAGLDPILNLKCLVVLFHVLAAVSMYALLVGVGGGPGSAFFGAAVYPIMTAHVARSAVHGHVHVVMFYALVPLLFLTLFRLGERGHRNLLWLALVLALGLIRDRQRTLLLLVMIGLLLPVMAAAVAGSGSGPKVRGEWSRRWVRIIARIGIAFTLAVGIDAFELLNEFNPGQERAGWAPGEQERFLDRWSLDNVHSFFDRDGVLAGALKSSGVVHDSVGRYQGLTLAGLALLGALWPGLLGGGRRRFWFVALFFPLSVWLGFGRQPPLASLGPRWSVLWRAADIPALGRGVALLAIPGLVILGALALGRNLPPGRGRWAVAALATAATVACVLLVAPLPLVQRSVFFLRELRNPEWFSVGIASFAIAFPAALVVGGLTTRIRSRAGAMALVGGLTLLSVLDFSAYRGNLTRHQRSPEALRDLRAVSAAIAADPDDGRVFTVEPYSNFLDTAAIWHGKRLAWDFRSYMASTRLLTFMRDLHARIAGGERPDYIGALAGIANIKYLLDERRFAPDLAPGGPLRVVAENRRVRALRNAAWRPFVQAWPEAALLVGGTGRVAMALAAELAAQNVALVQIDGAPDGDLLRASSRIYTDPEGQQSGRAPAGALVVTTSLAPIPPAAFDRTPEIQWSRPRPEQIDVETMAAGPFFLLVAESWNPGWTADIDGTALAVRTGGYAFLGAFVPAGSHHVSFQFQRQRSYWLWAGVSVISLVAVLAGLALARDRGEEGARFLE